jgi:hypothetical protein
MTDPERSSKTEPLDAYLQAVEECYERGWTDGLPVVPPTGAGLERILAGTRLPASQLVARVPPAGGEATVEKIALNALMAGCRPDYLPAVIAAVRAVCHPDVNVGAVQATTSDAAPLLIFNGPVVRRIGMNFAHNCLGQGNRANATIGRAVRLILMNLGGALPGRIDMATLGMPGKYSYCFAENEEANPWEPLHVERGFGRGDSAVTVHCGGAPVEILDHTNHSARGVLATVAHALSTAEILFAHSEILLIFSPEHSRTIAADGWTKDDARRFLYERARVRLGSVRGLGEWHPENLRLWPRWLEHEDDSAMIPVLPSPESVLIAVAGSGAGRFTAYVKGWGTRAVTQRIEA